MTILAFTVRNHKSVRDEFTLDLSRPSLRTLQPADGDWVSAAYPLAGIFGGNATGKSAILDAVRYFFAAIENTATTWQASKYMQRAPFALDGTVRTASSEYEIDFVYESRRYQYGFVVDHDGIKSEWLRDIPRSRWRTLLRRERGEARQQFHPSLQSRFDVTPRELILSRALLVGDSPLSSLARHLTSTFESVLVNDNHRESRLRDIADSLVEGSIDFDDLLALLRVADIGVEKVDVEETKLPEPIRRIMQTILQEKNRDDTDRENDEESQEDSFEVTIDEDDLAATIRHLVFTHRGVGKEIPQFSVENESDGTVAWLAASVPALETLRKGGLLIIDEIDASLHPHLLGVLLSAFADPAVNQKGAQLIFTSHESYVLSPLSDVELDPEQVWFTDKGLDGATSVSSLADYPRHRDANVSRRYLLGRYGGVPRLSPSLFASLVPGGEGR